MIYQFPHCTVLVAAERVATLFPHHNAPHDLARALVASIVTPDDAARVAAAEVTLAGHLVSYALRGTPSPSAFLKADGDLATHPLYAARVEAGYDADKEDVLVVDFILHARGESHPELPDILTSEAFVDRFAWFLLAANYCNLVKV